MIVDETLLIQVSRGDLIESWHEVDIAVCDAAGHLVLARGQPHREIYARSSAKPIQALPLIETGAADHYRLGPDRLALACASHAGEAVHTEAVGAWLNDLGLEVSALECGAHRPYDEEAGDAIVRDGAEPTALHNNCSGKHTGFLATALHCGDAPAGYIAADHPVQLRVTEAMEAMAGHDLGATARGIDGCGIPVIGMPLSGLARSMARIADPTGLGPVREAACRRIREAMCAFPHLVAGTGRIDTVLMKALPGMAFKHGAEAVQIAIIPERGLGIAMKARCGSSRATEVAILWTLEQLGLLDATAHAVLRDWLVQPIRNRAGVVVGEVSATVTD